MAARPMTPLCLVLLHYHKPLEEVDAHRPAHVAWIEKNVEAGAILLAGRRTPPTGGVLLFRGDTQAVAAEAARDPFVTGGVATFEVVAFTATLADEAIAALL